MPIAERQRIARSGTIVAVALNAGGQHRLQEFWVEETARALVLRLPVASLGL